MVGNTEAAFNRKDYSKALEWYRKEPVLEDADAQNRIGFLGGNGYGISQDYAEAEKWMLKAAEQGASQCEIQPCADREGY